MQKLFNCIFYRYPLSIWYLLLPLQAETPHVPVSVSLDVRVVPVCCSLVSTPHVHVSVSVYFSIFISVSVYLSVSVSSKLICLLEEDLCLCPLVSTTSPSS